MEVSYLVRTAPCAQVLCISLINVLPGDKSNHVPSFHLPQLYYFVAFATIMGWPALASGDSGWKMLANGVRDRIFGNKRCVLIVYAWCEGLSCSSDQTRHDARSCLGGHGTIHKAFHVGASDLGKDAPDLEFAPRNHHPFLLSDNRHYTFYVWRRIFLLHPIVPYLLIPGYIVCAWIWFLRVGA
jgi:alpha-1,2-glucosyltransferase